MLQQQCNDFMLVANGCQHIRGSGVRARLGAVGRIRGDQLEGFKQRFGELLGRVEIEGITNCLKNLFFNLRNARLQITRVIPQELLIHANAGILHINQHPDERHLNLLKYL